MIRRTLLLLVAGAAGLTAATPAAAQTDRPELLEVRFEGNEVVHSDTLQKIIQNRPTTCRAKIFWPICWSTGGLQERRFLYPRQVDLDSLRIVAYYRTVGYREATVDTSLVRLDEGARLGFTIQEGRPVLIDSIDYTVYDDPVVRGLLNELPLRTGDAFSLRQLDEVRDTLTARLQEAGYAYTEVLRSSFIPADDPYSARVGFEVDPGPRVRFGEVSVARNEELEDRSILRMLPFQEGQLFRPRLIDEGQRNVYGLEMIRNATVRPSEEARERYDTIVPVTVEVLEGDKHRVRAGAGWSTADCLNAEARWASRNFMGGGRRLAVSGRISNVLAPQLNSTACRDSGTGEFARLTGRVGVDLVQPSFFSSRNSVSASAFVERESLRNVFIREAIGLAFGVTRQISRRTTGTLSWQPQLNRLDADEYFCTSFLVCTTEDIEVFRSASWLAPIGADLVIDRANALLNPTSGWSLAIDLEHASRLTGSDFAYNRIAGELAGYFDVGGNVILALRARGGGVAQGEFFRLGGDAGVGIVHPQKRFYAGGANTVRGFGDNRLGPGVLTVEVSELLRPVGEAGRPACTAEDLFGGSCDPGSLDQDDLTFRPVGGSRMAGANVELRIPLGGETFQAAVFADAGQVWSTEEATDFGEIEFTPGVGIRYFSPIGPVRIDLGWRSGAESPTRVITSAIRPYDPMSDAPGDRITVGGSAIPWVDSGELRILERRFPYDLGDGWGRLQLHFSIGQAF